MSIIDTVEYPSDNGVCLSPLCGQKFEYCGFSLCILSGISFSVDTAAFVPQASPAPPDITRQAGKWGSPAPGPDSAFL